VGIGEDDEIRISRTEKIPIRCAALGIVSRSHCGARFISPRDLDIHHLEGFEEYRINVPSFIAKYGGRFIIRGGGFEVFEADKPHRIAICEFPDRQSIRNLRADEE